MPQLIKLEGFLPDLEKTFPGAIHDMRNILPSTNGFYAQPTLVDTGIGAISNVNSIYEGKRLTSASRIFAGTDTHIYEATLVNWTDRSGKTYSCDADDRWSFTTFGDYTLAANIGDTMQVSQGAAFSDISGSPQATYIAESGGFVMAVNLSTNADGWHCSAYNDYTDWTEAVSTQCTSGRLIGGGPITGVKKLGKGFLVFKERTMYIATYVGAPVVWQFDEVVGDIGCITGHAAVDIGDRIAFMGHDSFYIYDGARNVDIGVGLREWFYDNVNRDKLEQTIATYDKVTGNISFHFCSSSNTTNNPDRSLIYNLRTQKWGYSTQQIAVSTDGAQDAFSYNDFGTQTGGGTYNDISADLVYDFGNTGGELLYVGTDGKLYTASGAAGNTYMVINAIGDDEQFTTITRVRPRFSTAPVSSSMTYYYDDLYGDGFTEKDTYSISNGKYDLMHSSRWHSVQLNFTGNMEIYGVSVTLIPDGTK